MRKFISITLSFALIAACLAGCTSEPEASSSATTESPTAATGAPVTSNDPLITLSADGITLSNIEDGAVFTSNDIIYYEDRDTYDSGHAYGEGTAEDRHSAENAAAHTVVNITAPGIYRVTGELPLGQIRVDLGEEAFTDPSAVVTLILDNVNINCEVAPAILFLNVYECDNTWSTETASYEVDTVNAGANIVLAENSKNIITGSHVARIYKDGGEEKKLWKQDGAIYSYMSMNVGGDETGTLDLTADNEGLDTELHLTISGGNINIRSGNDGINTNEDGVSVTTINGGNLHIIAGLGEEGDGIDSNGWLVINGGTVVASANPAADAGMDSDMGSYINGGTVVALGSAMDWAESDSDQVTMNLQFAEYKDSGDAIVITKEDGTVVFAYDPSDDEILGENTRHYMGAILSCPNFAVEDTYHVYIGGAIDGEETAGIYDTATITVFSDGTQQAYTGTDVIMGFGGSMGGRPGGNRGQWKGEGEAPAAPEGEMPTMPEGAEPPEMPEGEMPAMPEGAEPPEIPEGEMPDMPEGAEPPEIPEGEMPAMPEGGFAPDSIDPMGIAAEGRNTLFYMQDKVNYFSGVTNTSTENE